MQSKIDIAEEILLNQSGLTQNCLHRALGQVAHHQVDYADLYFQLSKSESWSLEEGQVKEASYHIDKGLGVRAVQGEKTGFAYADAIHLDALTEAAKTARTISQASKQGKVRAWHKPKGQSLYTLHDPIHSWTESEKVALLQRIDTVARAQDPRVKQVMAGLHATHDVVLVAALDGTYAADIRPLIRLTVTVIAEENGRREQGFAGGGGRYDFDYFLEENKWKEYVSEAVRLALLNLEAIDAPAGQMDVVLGNGWPGVMLHEAVGHGLEGDFNRKGSSAFSGKIGQKVASEHCTVVDDGTIEFQRGSLNVDDEGTPTQCTTLIENGILKGYMQDKLNARLMNTKPTGNGRRESYSCLPMPRMTNTYMLPGKHTQEEIISSVKKGIFAVNFAGGQVDITSGQFVFAASEAYLIENGKVTRPVKGATLIGSGPEAMNKISMVGNDLKLDPGVGTCGKDGQNVPVCVGQPSLKMHDITVGGTA